ncbi:MAG TPA: FCD domain-containing protein [Casimicrobiaceae bacterium]|nr:FCD domain-containing protein [Casimicrobiaceae bacterium]
MPPRSPNPPSLTERVVTDLRARVRTGEFRGGAKLPSESELVATYAVSRTVIREAISQLRAQGLVATQRGIGTFARTRKSSPPELTLPAVDSSIIGHLAAIYELRISLETEAAALAAKRITRADQQRLARAFEAIAAAKNADEAVDADFAFHVIVAEATGNSYFADLLRHLGRAMIPGKGVDGPHAMQRDGGEHDRIAHREHQDIFHAIIRRDADAARAAMRTHLSNSRERLSLNQ